jgi:hypothetical protein
MNNMKQTLKVVKVSNAVFVQSVHSVSCSKEEQKQIKDALKIISKVEKILKIDKMADWTMLSDYRFTKNGFDVTVKQGACG